MAAPILVILSHILDDAFEANARLWFGLIDVTVCLFAGHVMECPCHMREWMIAALDDMAVPFSRLLVHALLVLLVLVLVISQSNDQRRYHHHPPPHVYYDIIAHPKDLLTQQVGN